METRDDEEQEEQEEEAQGDEAEDSGAKKTSSLNPDIVRKKLMDERRKNFAKKWYGKYNFIQR